MANLLLNSEFTSTTTSWLASEGADECTIESVVGGRSGNCLKFTKVSGSAYSYFYQFVEDLDVNKNYRGRIFVKNDMSVDATVSINIWLETKQLTYNAMTPATDWKELDVFLRGVAGVVTFVITVRGAAGSTVLFDSALLEEDASSWSDELRSSQLNGTSQNEISNSAFGVWSGCENLLRTEFIQTLPNAAFENTTGLTGVDCSLASVEGGQTANCLQITRTGGNTQSVYQTFTLSVGGRIYRASVYLKSGTSGNEAGTLQIRTGADVLVGEVSMVSTGEWVNNFFDVEMDSGDYRLVFVKNTATAGTMLFDTAQVCAIEPGFENKSSGVGPEGWDAFAPSLGMYISRETYGTNIRDGCMYSLYMCPSDAGEGVVMGIKYPSSISTLLPWWYRFRGRKVTFGCWVISESTKAGIQMVTSLKTITKYHSGITAENGAPLWEWLEISDTPAIDELNYFYVTCITESGAGNKYAHFAQPILAFVPYIGPKGVVYSKNEIIHLLVPVVLHSDDTVSGNTGLNLPAITPVLPRNMKAVELHITAQCATAGKYLDISGLRLYFPVANQPVSIQGWVPTTSGKVLALTRDDTITGVNTKVMSVELF